MNDDEAKRYIGEHVKVARLHVTIAKAFILKNFYPTTSELIRRFLQSVDATMPQQLVLHQSVDPIPTLDAVVSAISWQLAACEAIWGLIANAAVFPASTNLCGGFGTLQWTTVVPGSGGSSSGFSLEEFSIQVPDRLALPKSSNPGGDLPLTDPDLYLKELNLPGLAPAVETALREAVRCIRHELYLACLAMLGRASEAAWIETGLALASAVPVGSPIDGIKMSDQLQDPFLGIGKKIKIERSAPLTSSHCFSGPSPMHWVQSLRSSCIHSAPEKGLGEDVQVRVIRNVFRILERGLKLLKNPSLLAL